MIYRIYTEDLNRPATEKLVSATLDSFTLLPGVGYWLGKAEPCLIIEVISDRDIYPLIAKLGKAIKALNQQDAVVLTISENLQITI